MDNQEKNEGYVKTLQKDEHGQPWGYISLEEDGKEIKFGPGNYEMDVDLEKISVGTRVLFKKIITSKGALAKIIKIEDEKKKE